MAINKTNYIARLVEQKKLADLKDYFEKNIAGSKISCKSDGFKSVEVLITDQDNLYVGEYRFLNYNYIKTAVKKLRSNKLHVEAEMMHKLFIEFMTKTFSTYENDYLREIDVKTQVVQTVDL